MHPTRKEYLLVAVFSVVFILAVSSATFIVSFVFLATSRETEYRIIRQEYTALIERHVRDEEIEVNRLSEQLTRSEFVAQKRYELLRDEIDFLKRQNKQQ